MLAQPTVWFEDEDESGSRDSKIIDHSRFFESIRLSTYTSFHRSITAAESVNSHTVCTVAAKNGYLYDGRCNAVCAVCGNACCIREFTQVFDSQHRADLQSRFSKFRNDIITNHSVNCMFSLGTAGSVNSACDLRLIQRGYLLTNNFPFLPRPTNESSVGAASPSGGGRTQEAVGGEAVERGRIRSHDGDTGRRLRVSSPAVAASTHVTSSSNSRTPLYTYSRIPQLVYFLAPAHNAILTETYADVRARSRTIRYERNQQDIQELEAHAHRSEYARWRSFFDDVGSTRSYNTTSSTQDQYISWGRSMLLAYYLAKLGMYYAPKTSQNMPLRDKVRCAFCKRGKMGWWLYAYVESRYWAAYRATDLEIAIAMWKWHRSKSPTCPAVIDLAVDSLMFLESQRTEVNLFLLSKCYLPEESFSGSSVPPTSPSNPARRGTPRSRFDSPSNWLFHAKVATVVICPVEQTVPAPALPSTEQALTTQSVISGDELAVNEASYAYDSLSVTNMSEHDWIAAQGHVTDYSYTTPAWSTRITSLTRTMPYPLFVSEQTRELTYFCDVSNQTSNQQVNDQFYILECLANSGLQPGSNAWQSYKISLLKAASAGFYTTLNANEMICYSCGLRISEAELNAGDNCWVEHAYRSPECAHVLVCRGQAFVSEVQSRYNRGSTSGSWINTTYSDFLGFFQSIERRVEPRDYRARPEVRLLRAICEECHLNAILFAYAIESEMRRTGKDFPNLVALIDEYRELSTRMRITGVHDPRDFIRCCSQEAYMLARGLHSSQTTGHTTQVEGMAAPVEQRPPPPNAAESPDLELCRVCLDRPLEIAFVPCGHLSTCYQCSTRLNECPVCRMTVRGTLRVRLH